MRLLRVEFPAIGTTATVVARAPADLVAARAALQDVLVCIDRVASRFRADSELCRVQDASAGRPVPVGPLLWDALVAADRAYDLTGGLLDPTVGTTLVALGYDRDFAVLDGGRAWPAAADVPGWRRVTLDSATRTVAVPRGVVIDLGATAKALAVDLAAAAATPCCGDGVLLGVGGDLVALGPAPHDGWAVRVADSHRAGAADPGTTVVIAGGGLATSAPGIRRWGPPGGRRHHIVDPRSGAPAEAVWRSVTVAAATCLDANIASTNAVLLGADAPAWLESQALPALLRRGDGSAVAVAGWPTPEVAA